MTGEVWISLKQNSTDTAVDESPCICSHNAPIFQAILLQAVEKRNS